MSTGKNQPKSTTPVNNQDMEIVLGSHPNPVVTLLLLKLSLG